MYEFFFGNINITQVIVLCCAAVIIGIGKTGMPGLGILPVVALAIFFPAGFSTGLQLVMLCTADVMAMVYYRRKGNWKIVLRLIPFALAGIALGSLLLNRVDDAALTKIIGILILSLAVLNFIRIHYLKTESIPSSIWFSFGVGLAAGFTTQVANAAGPIMALYLLAMRLPKEEYMGTAVWYFLILNWIKLPIFMWEGRVTADSFHVLLAMIPFLLTGAVLGILFIKKAPQKLFERIVEIIIILSSLKLIFW